MLYEHDLVRKGLARWHNDRLIPIMRGGDGQAEINWPERPEDLTALDDDALSALLEGFQTAGRTLRNAADDRDPDILGERTQQDIIEELTAGADAVLAITAEQESRKSDEETFDAQVAEVAETFGADASDEAPESEEPEAAAATEDEPEAEAETASARQITRRPLPLAKRHKPQPVDVDERGMRSSLRAEELGIQYGDRVGEREVGQLLHHAVRRGLVAQPGLKLSVATARFPFPDDRRLGKREDGKQMVDPQHPNIRDVIGPEALVASGGLCAPLEPIYDIAGITTAVRPVRNALPNFEANRGGVIVRGSLAIGAYADAVGHITAADNETGGSLAVKNCMRVECPATVEVQVDAIYNCIEADNLAARSDPELMAAIDEIVRAEQARLADSFLLDRIKALSTAVTGVGTAGNGGVVVHLAGDVAKQAASYRSRHRMTPGGTLQALAPDWIIDAVALDYIKASGKQNTDPTSRAAAEANVRGMFAAFGVSVDFYLDGTSTASPGQVFGAQSAGATLAFPTTVEWFLFAPGTFVHLDAGTLDLGIVRDSTLNSTNDFQVFAETWENVAKIGVESRVITSTICPSGTFAAAKDLSAVC